MELEHMELEHTMVRQALAQAKRRAWQVGVLCSMVSSCCSKLSSCRQMKALSSCRRMMGMNRMSKVLDQWKEQ